MQSRVFAAILVCLLSSIFTYAQSSPSLTIRGTITTDKKPQSIRVLLENPKNKEFVRNLTAGADGSYEFGGLTERTYSVTVWLDGKKQDRRSVDIACRSGAIMTKDLFYGDRNTLLMFYFPAEDPDVVDAAELQGNYPKEVLKDYEKAYEDATNGNILRAVQRLEAIVAKAPGFYGAHARLGMIYQQNGCYADAEAEYAFASKLSPKSAQPLVNLASVQIQAADTVDDRMFMIEQALENLKKALSLKPLSSIAHCLSGAAYAKASSYEEAEASFKRAIEFDKDMLAARLMLAKIYIMNKNWQGALEHLNVYLDDYPGAPSRSVVKEMRKEAERNLKSGEVAQ